MNALQASIPRPRYERSGLRGGIVHLGLGGFCRAHLARYVHDLLDRDVNVRDWGVVGVGLMAGDRQLQQSLLAQDYLYTLVERDGASEQATSIGSIVTALHRGDGAAAILSAIDDARIVTLTVTENGYCLNPATKRLDLSHPGIAADLEEPDIPSTAIGIIVEGLQRRRARGARAFTGLSCDNIQSNGTVLRQAVLDYAEARDSNLAGWIKAEARFPNTMVDRITPALSTHQIEYVQKRYQSTDACPVFCEPFRQWVIEDDFADGRPRWEDVGAQLVADVAPYELMKLRLLNASHLALAGVGRLMGSQFVDETMADARIAAYVAALMDRETGPTLPPVPGVDLGSYKTQILQRFANPTIKDTLDRINTDAPVNYLLDPIRDRLRDGRPIELLSLALAAWIKRLGSVDDLGAAIPIRHPLANDLVAAAERGGPDARPVLSIATLFGELGQREDLVAPVSAWLSALYANGTTKTLERAIT